MSYGRKKKGLSVEILSIECPGGNIEKHTQKSESGSDDDAIGWMMLGEGKKNHAKTAAVKTTAETAVNIPGSPPKTACQRIDAASLVAPVGDTLAEDELEVLLLEACLEPDEAVFEDDAAEALWVPLEATEVVELAAELELSEGVSMSMPETGVTGPSSPSAFW